MHQYFKQNGYFVYGGGKLWHSGKMGSAETDPQNWTALYTGATGATGGPFYKWESKIDNLFKWSAGEYNLTDEGKANDTQLAQHMAGIIRNYSKSANNEKPFFIGCGFFRPHLPWNCHKKFYDLFDPDSLQIPQGYLENDLNDIANTGVDKMHQEILSDNKWKEGIRAYLANMAYADYNVGIVLAALDSSEFRDNTIVCFMGDHGWQLGEKDRWSKYALYDLAHRTTLIIYDPSAKGNGNVCKKVVSMQDLYPTLVALTGLPLKADIEGNNIASLLLNPDDKNWDKPILMTYNGVNMIKTNQWRWVNSDKSPQLYNTENDPYEWHNLVEKPEYADVIKKLQGTMDSIVGYGLTLKNKFTSTGYLPVKPKQKTFIKSKIASDSCLLLDLTYTSTLVELTVFDSEGKKVQQNRVYGESENVLYTLNGNLKPGIYLLHLKDDEKELTEKFIIN